MFDLQVECYAGHRGDESPRALIIDGQRYQVTEILQRWQEPGGRCFRVRVRGGGEYLVRQDAATESWLELGRQR